MDSLKRDLTEYDVEYTERVFTTADGISGLGPEPFVRFIHNHCDPPHANVVGNCI